jgi:NAD(P)-dependent dehydrogenase (short-subunit alcohol dehydrogenase family)
MKTIDLFDLTGKVSIITGGGDGLGQAMALGLAEAGSDVVVCSRKLEKCEATAHSIEAMGRKAMAFKCDVSQEEDIEQVVSQTVKEFQAIDVLVNNSGRTWGGPPEELRLEDWKKVIDVNMHGTFVFSQKVGKVMIPQKKGKIVNIASYAGLGGTDPEVLNGIAYNASKGGVIVFTKDLATKWASHNINVNGIAPGWFPTKMTKWVLENRGQRILDRLLLKRFGAPEDLKGAIVFLASKASDYMTGQILSVDGGISVWY